MDLASKFVDLSIDTPEALHEKERLTVLITLQENFAAGGAPPAAPLFSNDIQKYIEPKKISYYSYIHQGSIIVARCVISEHKFNDFMEAVGLDATDFVSQTSGAGMDDSTDEDSDDDSYPNIIYIDRVDVRPGYQGQKLCSRLLKFTINKLLAEPYGHKFITISNRGEPAISACMCYIGAAINNTEFPGLSVYMTGRDDDPFIPIKDNNQRITKCKEYCPEGRRGCDKYFYVIINGGPSSRRADRGASKYKKTKRKKRKKSKRVKRRKKSKKKKSKSKKKKSKSKKKKSK
jgi:hypothetical protein